MFVIEHHHRGAIRPEHAVHFIYCALSIRRVMQHTMGIHEVKASIVKRKPLGIGHSQVGAYPLEFKSPSYHLDRDFCKVDSCVTRPSSRKIDRICAETAADFKHLFAAPMRKRDD